MAALSACDVQTFARSLIWLRVPGAALANCRRLTERMEIYRLSGVGARCATASCGKAALPLDSPASCRGGSSGHHITQALPPWSRGPSPLCQISLYAWLLRTLVIGLRPAWITKDGPRSPHL